MTEPKNVKKITPFVWMVKILENLQDEDLRCWVGSVIWWNECKDFSKGWIDFEKRFILPYKPGHKLKNEALTAALNYIGYKVPYKATIINAKKYYLKSIETNIIALEKKQEVI